MHPLLADAEFQPCNGEDDHDDDHRNGAGRPELEEQQTLLPQEIEEARASAGGSAMGSTSMMPIREAYLLPSGLGFTTFWLTPAASGSAVGISVPQP